MRAILENVRSGEVTGHEVPQPELRPGGILVRTAFSAISAGTELAHREQVEKSLLGKAMARPDLVRQVMDFARTAGVKAAYQKVQSRLDTLAPLGYSCSGIVIAAGQGVPEFQPGDRVACAGAGYASHCEVNFIPKNLAVRVPEAVSLEAASLSAIGAIALQGFRQSQAVLGEVVAVVGAGLVGVLTMQLAKAAGCRVIAIDRDSQSVERARQYGADLALRSTDRDTASRVKEFARYGMDVAIITAATPSAEPVELAAHISRDRGRIVVVGTVDLGVSRKAMYMKELSLVLSRSYGPGRYDSQYEEEGLDYPVGYVRWTEKRNMEAFLDLLASGAVNVAPFLERRCQVEQGSAAYEELKDGAAYTVLLEYPSRGLISDAHGNRSAVAAFFAKCGTRVPQGRTEGELHRSRQFCPGGHDSGIAQDPRSFAAFGCDRFGCGFGIRPPVVWICPRRAAGGVTAGQGCGRHLCSFPSRQPLPIRGHRAGQSQTRASWKSHSPSVANR